MSPIMSATTVVGAGATTLNVLTGLALAMLSGQALATLEASTSAVAGEMLATFQSGLRVHCQGSPVNPAVAAGVIDGNGRDVILQGELVSGVLSLIFASTAGGATNATWRVTIAA